MLEPCTIYSEPVLTSELPDNLLPCTFNVLGLAANQMIVTSGHRRCHELKHLGHSPHAAHTMCDSPRCIFDRNLLALLRQLSRTTAHPESHRQGLHSTELEIIDLHIDNVLRHESTVTLGSRLTVEVCIYCCLPSVTWLFSTERWVAATTAYLLNFLLPYVVIQFMFFIIAPIRPRGIFFHDLLIVNELSIYYRLWFLLLHLG